MNQPTRSTEQQPSEARLFSLELFIAKFLRYGVLLAALLLFVGWMLMIDFHHDVFESFSHYHGVPLSFTLEQLFANHSYGRLISYLGLAVLISLPVIRVFLTAAVFVIERDLLLAACAAFVLVGLISSFVLGFQL